MSQSLSNVAVAGAIALLALGCSGPSAEPASAPPTAPSPTGSAPPTGPAPGVSSRWVGNSPDGMHVEQDPLDQCPAEFDLELSLTTSGAVVTGSATTRLRRVEARGPCGDVLGSISTYRLSNGVLEGDRISFDLGDLQTEPHRFTGSIAATRMTGTFALAQFQQRGRFVVTRQ